MLIKILVCFLAGMGAGLGTGFAGLSAAAVISPMLISFLDIPAYQAVAIALASDVLASAVSAYTYGKHKNLDVKNGTIMMACVLLFTAVGSYISSLVEAKTMGTMSTVMTMFLGLRFLIRPVMTTKEGMESALGKKQRIIRSVIGGCCIGFICGFVGAGGGMMMLLVLTSVLGYELKTAVGTSVFIMTFTALTGSASHFAIDGGVSDVYTLVFCIVFTFIWAQIAARIANRASAKTLNRITGIILILTGAVTIAFKLLAK